VLFLALAVDRLIGDPHSTYHPVALIGRFIGWWGRPEHYTVRVQRCVGVVLWITTTVLFTLPFFLFAWLAPDLVYLCIAPFLLKCCFAWRSLEEHTFAVLTALESGTERGRERVGMLVSRDTAHLDPVHIRSAAYESMTENLTDSIISPLFYFSIFGLCGAAVFRAANTMDAMLGYRDERARLGWCSARMDDVFNYIPARVTVLFLLVYFTVRGDGARAWKVMCRDGKRRPGFNGGIVMATMAGGCGIRFEKPGAYTIGDGENSLETGGREIILAVRIVTLSFAMVVGCALFLLAWLTNSTII
jgi:adenosylcobinamide-phosphate synthase